MKIRTSVNDRKFFLSALFMLLMGLTHLPVRSAEPPNSDAVPVAVNITGTVFQDDNGNAQLDAGEKGLPGIVVTDGVQLTQTDSQGHYSLACNEPSVQQFIFTVTPSGYRSSGTFYRPIPASGANTRLDFPLILDPAGAKDDFAFVQITDLHVVNQNYAKELIELINQAAGLKAAFAVATGDLTSGGGTTESQLQTYAAAIRQSPLPVFNVPGNHDIDAKTNNYTSILGPEYYAFDYGHRHFVVLNSILNLERQYEWLKKELALQDAQKEVLVFQHYPPDAKQLQFLANYNTIAVFSGHWHSSRVVPSGKILTVNTPPPFFGGIDLSPPTFRRITFQGGKMTLDEIYPKIGIRADWTASLARPEPAADAPKPAPGQDWPMLLHDPMRSGISGDKVTPPLKLAWRKTLSGTIHVSSPVIAGQTVYIGVSDEENHGKAGIYALDAATGAEKWHFSTQTSIRHSVSVANSLVYAATVEGNIIAVDAATGNLKWQYCLENSAERWMYASPVVQDGILYGGVAPVFVALDATTGKLIWKAMPMGIDWVSCPASPTAGLGMIFVGFNWSVKGFFALDQKTGKQRWNNNSQDFQVAYAAPSLAGQTLYVAANQKVFALEAETGKEKWKSSISGCGSTPVLAGNIVLVGSADGKIFGLDSVTGEKRWSYEKVFPGKFVFGPYQLEGSSIISSPAVSGTTAYFGTADGRFLALDTETGAESWSCELGAPITASAAISGNTVFTATYDGTVYAFTSAP